MSHSETERFLAVQEAVRPGHARDQSAEAALLAGDHPLNESVRLIPYVLPGNSPAGRCALSVPMTPATNMGAASLGFFECTDDQAAADELFEWARRTARDLGFTQLTGPVDASFWLRYRMKLDHFGDPYTSEPDNPPYYPKLWEQAGFEITQRYSSYLFSNEGVADGVERYEARREAALADGVRITPLEADNWDEVLPAVYRLTMDLYAPLPMFHSLSAEQFTAIFSPLRRVADPDLVTLAYRGDDLVGYHLVLPDYGDFLDRRHTALDLIRFNELRRHPKRIVSLYMGAAEPRLGSAMAARMIEVARVRGQQVISALMIEGGVSERMGAEHIAQRRQYALWSQQL